MNKFDDDIRRRMQQAQKIQVVRSQADQIAQAQRRAWIDQVVVRVAQDLYVGHLLENDAEGIPDEELRELAADCQRIALAFAVGTGLLVPAPEEKPE